NDVVVVVVVEPATVMVEPWALKDDKTKLSTVKTDPEMTGFDCAAEKRSETTEESVTTTKPSIMRSPLTATIAWVKFTETIPTRLTEPPRTKVESTTDNNVRGNGAIIEEVLT